MNCASLPGFLAKSLVWMAKVVARWHGKENSTSPTTGHRGYLQNDAISRLILPHHINEKMGATYCQSYNSPLLLGLHGCRHWTACSEYVFLSSALHMHWSYAWCYAAKSAPFSLYRVDRFVMMYKILYYALSSQHIHVHFNWFTLELVLITSESLARPSPWPDPILALHSSSHMGWYLHLEPAPPFANRYQYSLEILHP